MNASQITKQDFSHFLCEKNNKRDFKIKVAKSKNLQSTLATWDIMYNKGSLEEELPMLFSM